MIIPYIYLLFSPENPGILVLRQKDGWNKFPFFFFWKLARHLVVDVNFKRFAETVGSHGQNLQGEKENLSEAQVRNHYYWL